MGPEQFGTSLGRHRPRTKRKIYGSSSFDITTLSNLLAVCFRTLVYIVSNGPLPFRRNFEENRNRKKILPQAQLERAS